VEFYRHDYYNLRFRCVLLAVILQLFQFRHFASRKCCFSCFLTFEMHVHAIIIFADLLIHVSETILQPSSDSTFLSLGRDI
jgi:hypothetical protein